MKNLKHIVKSGPVRSKDSYRYQLYEFMDRILVVCPSCGRKAIVYGGRLTGLNPAITNVKVVCGSCGFNKYIDEMPKRQDDKQKKGLFLLFGKPVDPYFRLPLWLQSDFENEVFWAYNEQHLALIEEHVAAGLRERNGQDIRNKSIGARLPRWLTSAKNRSAVLKMINELRITN